MKATVRIPGFGGQGVLVPGHIVLTATHCINWDPGMMLGTRFVETAITPDDARLRLEAVFADPVSDMAVLAPLDNQEAYEDCEAFEKWCESTEPVPLSTKTPRRFRSALPVQVLTHKGEWIKGRLVRAGIQITGTMFLETDEQIEGGTSGGPVVDSDGRLVGVVSWAGARLHGGKCQGAIPVARLALPDWVWRRIHGQRLKLAVPISERRRLSKLLKEGRS